MRFFLFGIFLLMTSSPAYAHVPVIIEGLGQSDVITIDDPDLSQAFYGEMAGFPHTYEIRISEPLKLYAHILVPDIESSKNNISGIIIKERIGGGRVTEITRLLAKDGAWVSEYEPFGGDSYREGPQYETTLEPGTYRLEVNTPDNVEKYVLVVGTREEMTIGYFEMIQRLAKVKQFFGKPTIFIIQSPYVYVPLVIALLIYVWYRRRSRMK